jgi:type IV secretory pathway VirB2 component (pilin)
VTPQQELALLNATVAGLDDELRAAFEELVSLIQGGMAPREAVQQIMDSFQGAMAETMAVAMSGILAQSVGTGDVMELKVGAVSLSRKLLPRRNR